MHRRRPPDENECCTIDGLGVWSSLGSDPSRTESSRFRRTNRNRSSIVGPGAMTRGAFEAGYWLHRRAADNRGPLPSEDWLIESLYGHSEEPTNDPESGVSGLEALAEWLRAMSTSCSKQAERRLQIDCPGRRHSLSVSRVRHLLGIATIRLPTSGTHRSQSPP